jgi:hypothetical protein
MEMCDTAYSEISIRYSAQYLLNRHAGALTAFQLQPAQLSGLLGGCGCAPAKDLCLCSSLHAGCDVAHFLMMMGLHDYQ